MKQRPLAINNFSQSTQSENGPSNRSFRAIGKTSVWRAVFDYVKNNVSEHSANADQVELAQPMCVGVIRMRVLLSLLIQYLGDDIRSRYLFGTTKVMTAAFPTRMARKIRLTEAFEREVTACLCSRGFRLVLLQLDASFRESDLLFIRATCYKYLEMTWACAAPRPGRAPQLLVWTLALVFNALPMSPLTEDHVDQIRANIARRIRRERVACAMTLPSMDAALTLRYRS